MSEARDKPMVTELREAAPAAPDSLRERVRELREPQPGRAWRLRPALVAAVGDRRCGRCQRRDDRRADGIDGSEAGSVQRAAVELSDDGRESFRRKPSRPGLPAGGQSPLEEWPDCFRKTAPPSSPRCLRANGFSASTSPWASACPTSLAPRRLQCARPAGSAATSQRPTTRRAVTSATRASSSACPSAGSSRRSHASTTSGRSSRSTSWSTTSRRLSTGPRHGSPRCARSSPSWRRRAPCTPAEQFKLDRAKRTVLRLTQTATRLVREGSFARISLRLTTRQAAAKSVEPGRFDRFWGDAGEILGKEAIAVLYALVIAGPFLILAALALLAERARRRRADHRLLGETG